MMYKYLCKTLSQVKFFLVIPYVFATSKGIMWCTFQISKWNFLSFWNLLEVLCYRSQLAVSLWVLSWRKQIWVAFKYLIICCLKSLVYVICQCQVVFTNLLLVYMKSRKLIIFFFSMLSGRPPLIYLIFLCFSFLSPF